MEINKGIVTPVLANLITAAFLFWGAVLFKGPIYGLLAPPTTEDYPVYVVLEPYTNDQGRLDVDLFVINLRGVKRTNSDLVELLESEAIEQGRNVDPDIRLVWKPGLRGKIVRITPDEAFNRGKGRIVIKQEESGEWRLKIIEIGGKGILKFMVATTREATGLGRGAKTSVPFKYRYPGE